MEGFGWRSRSCRLGAQPYNTVAFFGLARIGDELWAAGIDGLYRLRGPDSVQRMPMPQFRRVGDFQAEHGHSRPGCWW